MRSATALRIAPCGTTTRGGLRIEFRRVSQSAMRSGFTLIEVLITLFVLVIGLTGSLAVIMGASRVGNKASDRNIVGIILDDAIADIQRNHLITVPTNSTFPLATTGYNAKYVQANEVGLYIETVTDTDSNLRVWPNIQTAGISDYTGTTVSDCSQTPARTFGLTYGLNAIFPNELLWPIPNARFNGSLTSTSDTVGGGYRVVYRLERHPNWVNGELSFYGVYVLTLAVYKDLNPAIVAATKLPKVPPNSPNKMLEQVSDPMVVYLHAKGGS